MMQKTPTWAVVATIHEPAVLVQAFAIWHLKLGAAQVTLCFDQPDDPAADLMQDMPGVRVIRCDAAHWRGARPVRHQIRQVENAQRAYDHCDQDWLLHCDADEFLRPRDTVAAALARCAQDDLAAILPVAERCYLPGPAEAAIFDGAFRLPFATQDKAARHLGQDADLTRRGVTGHAHGKAFARSGCGLSMSIHRPKKLDPDQMALLNTVPLLHFDGLTPLHWINKLLTRADGYENRGGMKPSPHRMAQMAAVRADRTGGFALHDRLKRISAGTRRSLRMAGLLLPPEPDIAAALPSAIDLSPAAFDADLTRRYPDLITHLAQIRSP
jgi:hypothetical protein